MGEHGQAFQAGIAGSIYDVTETMTKTHDALIRAWGSRRRSGISWLLFGPKTMELIGLRRSGDIGKGWDRLGAMMRHGVDRLGDADGSDHIAHLKIRADAHPYPTLVIAHADVDDAS